MNLNTILRKSVLAVAGLGVAAGVAAGPATSALAAPHTGAHTAAVQADKSGAHKPRKSSAKLIPHGTQGKQSRIALSNAQEANAQEIIAATKKSGMGKRAAVIAVATAMQESKLKNLGNLGDANDHDSLGLFQQRPSAGWGSPDEITDPQYATTAFLKGLKQVDGWRDMPLTKAAQTVQVSAYPFAYAQWEKQAAHIVANNW